MVMLCCSAAAHAATRTLAPATVAPVVSIGSKTNWVRSVSACWCLQWRCRPHGCPHRSSLLHAFRLHALMQCAAAEHGLMCACHFKHAATRTLAPAVSGACSFHWEQQRRGLVRVCLLRLPVLQQTPGLPPHLLTLDSNTAYPTYMRHIASASCH
jgi:hypothetical protein